MAEALLADVGGTNARFALLSERGLGAVRRVEVRAFAGPVEAIESFLGEARPARAVLSVGGPVEGGRAQLTNGPWCFSAAEIGAAFGFESVTLVNDYTALAHAVPHLGEDDLARIGGGTPVPEAAAAILGPGTGLGVAGLIPAGRGFEALVGEGGHVTMAPADRREGEVLDRLRQDFGHVSAERVLSGEGLVNLYRALAGLESLAATTRTPAEITRLALAGNCPLSTAALEMFCAMLGTVAGNLALTFGARRGVYLAGGILPRFVEYLARSPFRQRFVGKGRFESYLEAIPTSVITRRDPAFLGLAALAGVRGQPSPSPGA